MRTKITSGLVATSADGSPSVRPPIPSSWNRSSTTSEGGNESSLDGNDSKPGTAASSPTPQQSRMSSSADQSATDSPPDSSDLQLQAKYGSDGGGGSGSVFGVNPPSSSSSHEANTLDNTTVEKSGEAADGSGVDDNVCVDNNNATVGENQNPSPPSSSEPHPPNNHVNISSSNNNPRQQPLQPDSVGMEPVDSNNSNMEPTVNADSSPAVSNFATTTTTSNVPKLSSLPSEVTHMSAEDPCDMDKEIDVECSQDISEADFHAASVASAVPSMDRSKTLGEGSGSVILSSSSGVVPSSSSNNAITASSSLSEKSQSKPKLLKELDPVSMTIESVAAGEGEPPAFLFLERTYTPQQQMPQTSNALAGNYKKTKMDKSGGNASARLPVISSLLAPAGVNSTDAELQQMQNSSLPSIQHMASGNARSSSSPSNVLPSVAHFLGPAKSPPSAFTPQQNSPEMYGGMYPSSAPRVGSEAGKAEMSHLGNNAYQDMTPSKPNKITNRSKSVTPAGLRLSMAASEELPDPLPLPQYSDKVLRAKQMGTIAFDRPTVLRETVQFYLQFKHYWSSHDYDRISNLVVELFPEFKDTETPGVPVNKRIRTDLSMYARNFRRREVSQRKKEGTPSSSEADREVKSEGSTPTVGAKTFQHSPSPTSGSLASSNPSDFCNELLTAASIIESQNSSSAVTKTDDLRSQSQNSASSNQLHYQRGGSSKGHHHQHQQQQQQHHHQQHHHSNAQGGEQPAMQKQDGQNSGGRVGGKVVMAEQQLQQQQQHQQLAATTTGGNEEEGETTPIHFLYDKEAMSAALSRDATTAWQIYSDQVAQAMSGGTTNAVSQEYDLAAEDVSGGAAAGGSNSDRLSAMAMWRSTALPDPLPIPPYSDAVIRARESGNTMSARPKIIRETTQFFLSIKLWWTAPDYERIAELVLQNFPALVSLPAIKKDLGTCARNMRRRLPSARSNKTPGSPSKASTDPSSSSAVPAPPHQGSGVTSTADTTPGVQGSSSSSDYMKALLTAQNMNELGMTQRNLGELAALAGIKQRLEQRPQDVSDIERQYLAQCTSEEQRQALLASGAFGNDSTAMAALSAIYGQLGVDISPTSANPATATGKRASGGGGVEYTADGTELGVEGQGHQHHQSKRQRRISQAEVERRLKEAELSANSIDSRQHHHQQQQQHHQHHHQQQQQQHQHHHSSSNLGLSVSVGVADKSLVKREPLSPHRSSDGLKHRSSSNSNYKDPHHHQQQQHHQHHQQHHQQQQQTMFPPTQTAQQQPQPAPSSHDQVYWDAQAIANMALLNHTNNSSSSSTSSPYPTASQAHSHSQQQQQQQLPPSHIDVTSATAAVNAGFSVSDTPMNLTYDGDKQTAAAGGMTRADPSPLGGQDNSLPDTASLAAQVEVTTSANTKSHHPRRRTSSSPRAGDASREQVWFPHGAGFKKENQEVVSLPDPLPIPEYSAKIVSAREEGSLARHRSEIIRETARFFLGLKYWWSSADYTRISELVVQQFPELRDDNQSEGMNSFRRIQRDLSMCARNLRRSKKPRRERGEAGLHHQDPNLGGGGGGSSSTGNSHPVKRNKRMPGERKVRRVGAGRTKRNKGLGGGIGGNAATTSSHAAHHGSGSHPSVTAIPEPVATVAMPSVNEETEAAAALLQQQFMQQSSSYQHPSAHLLPSSHLLPSLQTHPALHEQQLQTHPALHDQQVQLNSGLLQAQLPSHPHLGIDETGKGLVKDEPCANSMDDGMGEQDSGVAGLKSSMGKSSPSPLLDSVHSEAQEVARALARGPGRDLVDGGPNDKLGDQDKVGEVMPHAVIPNTMKVYQDPEHGNDLQERFAGLWRKGKFFDASLGVASKKLHVHKLVLLAMSPYLQETFKNADPRSQLEVNLPSDTTYETAKAFLKYIYEGILEVDTSSVRSLHKIATMLQMSKLAQYCQNFAQQLHEAAESASTAVQGGDLAKIAVTLGDFAQLEAVQRQKILEAQALQRLGDTTSINSSDLQPQPHHHRMHGGSRYQLATEEQNALKTDYHANSDSNSLATHNFLQQEALAQHRALIAATASVQSSTSSSLPPSSLLLTSSTTTPASSSTQQQQQQYHHASHHLHNSQQLQQQQEQQHLAAAMQNDNNAALLHRLASSDAGIASSSTNSLDQQQRLALAAYWQAHAQSLELMSRGNQLDPATLTPAELAAVASAEEQRQLLSTLSQQHEMNKVKGGGRGDSHSTPSSGKEWVGAGDGGDGVGGGSHGAATMLPETCIPVDMARSHQVANAEGT